MQITLKDGWKVSAPDKQITKILHGCCVHKPNETKAEIINTLFTTLQNFGAENIVVEKAEKLITFSFSGKNFKLDLIQQKDKK